MENTEAILRVTGLDAPKLKGIDYETVKNFNEEYKRYAEHVKTIGKGKSSPISRAQCVEIFVKNAIFDSIGLKSNEKMTDDRLEAWINKQIKDGKEEKKKKKDDGVFKGLSMRKPVREAMVARAIGEYSIAISKRAHSHAFSGELNEPGSKELRKKIFPDIIKGVWPPVARTILRNKWEIDGKDWTLAKLKEKIKDVVLQTSETIFAMEKEKTRENKEERKDEKKGKQKEKYRGAKDKNRRVELVARRRDDLEKPNSRKANELEVKCYNCEGKGHKAFECPKPGKTKRAQEAQREYAERAKTKFRRVEKLMALREVTQDECEEEKDD